MPNQQMHVVRRRSLLRASAIKVGACNMVVRSGTFTLLREATLATAQRLLLRELATLEDETATLKRLLSSWGLGRLARPPSRSR